MRRSGRCWAAPRSARRDGDGLASSIAAMAMMKPGSQSPHIVTCSASHACCTGCAPFAERPSIVVTVAPSSSRNGTLQLITARPSTITVHAPQSRLSQAIFGAGEVRRIAQRPQQGRVRIELDSTPCPLSVIRVIGATLARRAAPCQEQRMSRVKTSTGRIDRLCRSRRRRRDADRLPPRGWVGQIGVAPPARAFRPVAPRGRVRLSRLWRQRPRAEGTTRDDYAAAILSAMASARHRPAHTSAACRSAAWSPSRSTMRRADAARR